MREVDECKHLPQVPHVLGWDVVSGGEDGRRAAGRRQGLQEVHRYRRLIVPPSRIFHSSPFKLKLSTFE